MTGLIDNCQVHGLTEFTKQGRCKLCHIQKCLGKITGDYSLTQYNEFKQKYPDLYKDYYDKRCRKTASTCIKKYGVKNPYQIDYIRKKAENSIKQKPKKKKIYIQRRKSKEDKALEIKERMQRLHGVDNPSQLPGFKEKFNTSIRKHRQHINYDYLDNLYKIYKRVTTYDITNIVNNSNASRPTVLRFLKNQNIIIDTSYNSKAEIHLYDFIKSINPEIFVLQGDKQIIGNQLDIYVPELKLGIEFNGNYWHQENCVQRKINPDYHVNKTNLCEQQGIRLIHIWEHEWLTNQDYCKYVIECYLDGKIPDISIYNNKLPRDYFQTLDFPDGKIEEPEEELIDNKFKIYKTGYIIL